MEISSQDPQPNVLYLDDFKIGTRYLSNTHTLDEKQILAFAKQFDPQPFHLDDNAARATLLGGLAASGWHTAAITMNLIVTGPVRYAGGMIGVGVELNWPTPTRPGDILQAESEIEAIMPSRSRPDQGIVTVRTITRNQRGDVVQDMRAKLMVPRRTNTSSAI
jgi:acyl dehydratase